MEPTHPPCANCAAPAKSKCARCMAASYCGAPAVTRGAFAALKGRLQRLALHGAVPEVFKDAARAAGLEVRGR